MFASLVDASCSAPTSEATGVVATYTFSGAILLRVTLTNRCNQLDNTFPLDQPCSRAASGLRPEVLWPPARSWLTAARKAPQKARPDAVRRTPQQSDERRAGGRIPPVISGDPEMDLTARQVTGCGVPHQRLSALCSPHFFRGAENRR